MSANHLEEGKIDLANRDRMLRCLIGCFAAAAFTAFGLAVATSVLHQSGTLSEPVALAQDEAR